MSLSRPDGFTYYRDEDFWVLEWSGFDWPAPASLLCDSLMAVQCFVDEIFGDGTFDRFETETAKSASWDAHNEALAAS